MVFIERNVYQTTQIEIIDLHILFIFQNRCYNICSYCSLYSILISHRPVQSNAFFLQHPHKFSTLLVTFFTEHINALLLNKRSFCCHYLCDSHYTHLQKVRLELSQCISFECFRHVCGHIL